METLTAPAVPAVARPNFDHDVHPGAAFAFTTFKDEDKIRNALVQ